MNADGEGSDDDGLAALPTLTLGLPATFNVTATNSTGTAAKMNVWIDFNNNGSFEDAGEKVGSEINVATGVSNGSVTVPSFTVPGAAYTAGAVGMRIRLSNTASLTSLGAAASGEVEDYKVTVILPTLVISRPRFHLVSWGHLTTNHCLSLAAWPLTAGR